MRSVFLPLVVISAVAALTSAAQAQTRSTATTALPPPSGQPAPAGAPGAPLTGTGAGATAVNPVTVQPPVPQQGRVVSSTDATSLQSPNYSAEDAKPPPRAVSLGGNAAAGVQSVTPSPPSGLPASLDPGPQRSELGVTAVF